jgi:hypothetical protein
MRHRLVVRDFDLHQAVSTRGYGTIIAITAITAVRLLVIPIKRPFFFQAKPVECLGGYRCWFGGRFCYR